MRSPSNAKPKLLIIDDEPNNLDLLERTFYRTYEVFRATSGIEALGILEQEGEVAVVISDQQMPHMSGIEFFNQILVKYPDTIRIILTAYTDVADLVEAINSCKVFKYVTKPFNKENLINIVAQAVDTYTAIKARTQQLRQDLESAEFKYRSIFENSIEGIFQTTVDGHYLIANPMLAHIYGYESVEQLISSITNIQKLYVDPNRRHEFINLMQLQNTVSGFESQVYRRDRSKIWISENVRAMRNAEGRVTEFEGTVQDITQRKRAEEELHLLQTMTLAISGAEDFHSALGIALQKICEYTGWAIGEAWTPSQDGQLLECSSAWYSSIHNVEEFRNFTKTLKFQMGIGFPGRVWARKCPEWIWNISQEPEMQFPRKYIALEVGFKTGLGIPILAKGQVVAIIAFFMLVANDDDQRLLASVNAIATQLASVMQRKRDEEEIHRVNEELALARDQALEASRTKSAFVANMSHELRTPLNAIIGYSEMLQEDVVDLDHEELVPDLSKIHAAGKHLLALINDILDLSKIEAGKMELYLESFDVPTLVRDATNTIRPLLEKNANTLVLLCEEQVGTMHSDVTKLRQALFNLLSNACKFTHNGTITLEVTRKTLENRDWINFSVTDTGIGITPEQLVKLFQDFAQADNSTTRKYGGTGLGLAISQRFCQMMGGDITVTSELEVGSTFTIYLPVNLQEVVSVSNSVHTKEEQLGEHADDDWESHKPTVLVIDDDPTVHDLMKRFLTKKGFNVQIAKGGEEGVRRAKEVKPHAITLDVMMPSMDGWAVLSALKADPETVDIPVIMLTMVNDKSMGYALGATDYLTKPINRDKLASTLNRYRGEHFPTVGTVDTHSESQFSRLSVLIVEDEHTIRQILRRILEKENCTVTEAGNGHEALEIMSKNMPQLILLDLMMPEMDGFQFIERVRQQSHWPPVPIILLTAMDLTHEERSHLNGSVQKILQKGAYSRQELLDEISYLLGLPTSGSNA